MILFHHRAFWIYDLRMTIYAPRFRSVCWLVNRKSEIEIGCRGWNRTRIRAFKGRRPTIRRPGRKKWGIGLVE